MDMFAIDEMTTKDLSYLDGFDLHLVSSEQELEDAFAALTRATKEKDPIGLDIETTGLSPIHHEIVSVIMSPPDDKTSYYFPLKHKIGVNVDEVQFLAKFEQLCKEARFVLHNGKFDWEFIWHNWNIDFEISDDTMLMAYVLNSNLAESGKLGLKYLTGKYFDYHPLELSDFKEYDFSRYDPEEGYKYAAPDTINTVKLYHKFKPMIKKFHLERVYRVEMNIVKMLGRMELQGVDVDPTALQAKEEAVKKLIDELTQKIQDMAGHPFDVASPQQLSNVLYQELKIKPTKSHGKDDFSTGADVMRKMQNAHPIIPLVLDLREAQKLYNDFILKLPECLAEDHKIHSRFVQTGTRSGRFSSAGGYGRDGEQIRANMQQLPNDKKLADGTKVSVREAFVAPEGFLWVSCDFRTMEYKTCANLAHEDQLIEDLRNKVDFHVATAALMLGKPKEEVTKEDRKRGKCVTGDTLVHTSMGIRRIDSFAREGQQPDTFVPVDVKLADSKGNLYPADSLYYSGEYPVTEIVTQNGLSIKGTTDKHTVLVMDNTTTLPYFKKLSDIAVGDYVLISTRPLPNERTEYLQMPLADELSYRFSISHDPETEEDARILEELRCNNGRLNPSMRASHVGMPKVKSVIERYNAPAGKQVKKDRVIKTVTPDVAELWGMILSDGTFAKSGNTISFKVSEEPIAQRFAELVESVLNEEIKLHHFNSSSSPYYEVALNSQVLSKQFHSHNTGDKSHTMYIPQVILDSPANVQTAFVQGFFNGNSSIQASRIETGSVSKTFIFQLQQLLLNLGVLSSVYKEADKKCKGDYYTLLITRYEACKRFHALVTLEKSRQSKLDALIEYKEKCKYHTPPAGGTKALVDKAFPGLDSKNKHPNVYALLSGEAQGLGRRTAERLDTSSTLDANEHEFLRDLIDGNLALMKVTEVNSLPPEPLYDFHIPVSHEFVSNGFISHNTLSFGTVYGMSAKSLADMLRVPLEDAKQLQAKYFENMPNVSKFMAEQRKMVLEKGLVRTCSGRIRIFSEDIKRAREKGDNYAIERAQKAGANTAVQGSAADLAKLAMWRLDCLIEPYRDKIFPVLQIHDAVDFIVSKDFPLDKFYQLVNAAMVIRDVPEWAPIDIDVEIGENYGNLHSPEYYGLDTEALDANNPFIELLPDCDWFFDPIRKETTAYYDKLALKPADTGAVFMDAGVKEESERSAKINARKAELLEKYAPTVTGEPKSPNETCNNAGASKPENNCVVISPLFDDSQDEEAFAILSDYISSNYGTFDLVLMCAGGEYRFPPDYRVNPDKMEEGMKRMFGVEVRRGGKPKSLVLDL